MVAKAWRAAALGAGFAIVAALVPPVVSSASAGEAGAKAVAETQPQPGQARPPSVTVVEAAKTTFVDDIHVTGSLVPREEVLVGPQIDGLRITHLLVDEGDRVEDGQVLAQLSRTTLEAQLAQNAASLAKANAAIEQARSQISEAEATLKQAKEAFDRIKPLLKSGAASQATYDEREALYRTANARLQAARDGLQLAEADKRLIEAQRQELEVKLGFTEIRTPEGGLIARRNARVGAVSSAAAESLFRIIKDGEVELAAEVPEFYMPKLAPGQKAKVSVAGVGEREGKVRLVSPEVDPQTRLGRVRILLGDDPALRVGSFARGVISAGQRESVGVPTTAVLYDNDRSTVFVVKGNQVEEREVKTGLVSGNSVEIREGLEPGELVVQRAGTLLRDGETITPVLPSRTLSEVRK